MSPHSLHSLLHVRLDVEETIAETRPSAPFSRRGDERMLSIRRLMRVNALFKFPTH